MKKLFLLLILFFNISFCFCNEITYVLKQNSYYYMDGNLFPIEKGSIVTWNSDSCTCEINVSHRLNFTTWWYEYSGKDSSVWEEKDVVRFPLELQVINNDKKVFVNAADLMVKNNADVLQKKSNLLFMPVYYLEFLQGENFDDLTRLEPKWLKLMDYYPPDPFDDPFWPEYIEYGDIYFYVSSINDIYLVKEIKKSNMNYEIVLIKATDSDIHEFNQPTPDILLDIKRGSTIKIICSVDNDFVKIWVNSKKDRNYICEYFTSNKITKNEIHNLIVYKSFNKTNITWPRHADGTCDYEKGNTLVASSGSATNVSINRTMSVKENLKLRSAEATSSNVLTVMSAGTKVKVLELGKEETIDGIKSNWVKEEVISGKDREGKDIKKKTTGWCYGGYLE